MHAERRPGSSAAISEQLLVFPIARDYDSVYRFCRFDVDVCRYSASGEMRTLTFEKLPVGSDVYFMHVYAPLPRDEKACFIGIFSLAWPAGDT